MPWETNNSSFKSLLFYRYLFNDAEVKPFDSAQLASECFGGEMTVSYDSCFCHVPPFKYLFWRLSWTIPKCSPLVFHLLWTYEKHMQVLDASFLASLSCKWYVILFRSVVLPLLICSKSPPLLRGGKTAECLQAGDSSCLVFLRYL